MIKTLILMPHYNNIEGLYKSIKSIIEHNNQFIIDLLVVDDGSKYKPNIVHLQSLYKLGKVYFIDNHLNRGIEYALNDGLKFAVENHYNYIARLDCGDVCYPNRFNKQLNYLQKNPLIKLLGAWCNRIDIKTGKSNKFCPPTDHESIVKHLKMHNVFCHPLIMFSVDVIDLVGYYPLNYRCAEDYAYFSRIAKVARVANLPEVLLDYEINPGGISLSRRKLQIKSTLKVIKNNFDFSFYSYVGLSWYSLMVIMPYRVILIIKNLLNM